MESKQTHQFDQGYQLASEQRNLLSACATYNKEAKYRQLPDLKWVGEKLGAE